MRETPPVVSRQDEFLAAVCDRLDAQNELLARILDRLPEPAGVNYTTTMHASGPVELREPEPPASTSTPAEPVVAIEEPAPAKVTQRRTRKPRTRPAE